MLKFGGSRPESDGTGDAAAKDQRKQRHQRSAANAGAGANAAAVGRGEPGNGTSAMDTSRGVESTPKVSGVPQMAPPDIPFGTTGQPPVV